MTNYDDYDDEFNDCNLLSAEFSENITLTLIPLDKKDEPTTRVKNEHVIEVWKHFRQYTTPFEDVKSEDTNDKIKPVLSRVTNKWRECHADLLVLSQVMRQFAYEVVVEHLATNRQFKAFYYDGKTQICNDLNETFNKSKLL